MFRNAITAMSRYRTLQRTRAITQQMMQSTAAAPTAQQDPVLFEENGPVRKYILNRPNKLNALDGQMIAILRQRVQEWEGSQLCRIIVGTGAGKGLCAGGDVEGVVRLAQNKKTLSRAKDFFKQEFELDFLLASVSKLYVVVCDGPTMGGGFGLSAHAPFRIATENSIFAMPETKIGYAPDVGANHFLPLLDGQIGTYLALTGNMVYGKHAFELGLATHFVPKRRIPALLDQLASLDEPTYERVNNTIEEHFDEPAEADGTKYTPLTGDIRVALDTAFGHNSVEEIFASLEDTAAADVGSKFSAEAVNWAKHTLQDLSMRSPTSLNVALEAIRSGRHMSLADVLRMELGIATAFLSGASPDFKTGVTAVLIDKNRKDRPKWVPDSIADVEPTIVRANFFKPQSEFLKDIPTLDLPERSAGAPHVDPLKFALPTEAEIEKIVRGTHPQSGGVAYSVDDLVTTFARMTRGKHGVEAKVREVAARRCEVVEDPDRQHTLRWKDTP